MMADLGKDEKQILSSRFYRGYVLAILTLVYVFNYIDRTIISILLPYLKADLGLSDTQLGFLYGFSFAVLYVVLGIPIASLADRVNRVNIMAIALAAWSLMTGVCGLTQNFAQLALARVGVGIGEAGCTPPAQSVLADYFPPTERPLIFAIYGMGAAFGSGLGLLLGGWIAQHYGWRMALFVVGFPGIFLAALVKLTLREPPRGFSEPEKYESNPAGGAQALSFREGMETLKRSPAFIQLTIAVSLSTFATFGVGNWFPTFLQRSYGWSTTEIGSALGAIQILAGGAGMLFGGWLTSRLMVRDIRWLCFIPMLSLLAGAPFYLAIFLTHSGAYVIWLLIIPMMIGAMSAGPIYAAIQHVATLQTRALAIAVLFFFANLIGMGGGPLAVGVLSDLLSDYAGEAGLRYSLLAVVLVASLWSSWHFRRAGEFLRAGGHAAAAAPFRVKKTS